MRIGNGDGGSGSGRGTLCNTEGRNGDDRGGRGRGSRGVDGVNSSGDGVQFWLVGCLVGWLLSWLLGLSCVVWLKEEKKKTKTEELLWLGNKKKTEKNSRW